MVHALLKMYCLILDGADSVAQEPLHKPVLINEVIDFAPNPCEVIFDFTLGRAGHAIALLEARPEAKLYGSDRDPQAILEGEQRLAPFKDRVELFLGTFSEAAAHWKSKGLKGDLALADLGVSSPQIDQAERGFSFMKSGPLDMRMSQNSSLTAFEVINNYDKNILEDINLNKKIQQGISILRNKNIINDDIERVIRNNLSNL